MGINGLLPFLKKASTPVNIREFKGYTVAVDTYCWLHKSAYACAMDLALGNPTDQYVRYTMKYLELLFACNIKPILVFDGANLPSKAETERKRRESKESYRKKAAEFLLQGDRASAQECFQRSIVVTPKMAQDVLTAARNLGVDCIVAPYEADSQLAYLNRAGYADLIITEDSDLLLFGCRQVLFKFDLTGSAVLVALTSGIGELCCGMRPNQFNDSTLRFMGIISGCDYFPGIPGIGLVTAAKILRQTRISDFRELLTKLGLYANLTPTALSATGCHLGPSDAESHPIVTSNYRNCRGSKNEDKKRNVSKQLHPSLVDAAVRAERTFRLQVVFDPLTRCQRRLSSPTPEDVADEIRLASLQGHLDTADKENLFAFAGTIEADKSKALQIALGNVDFHTGETLGTFDPDQKQKSIRHKLQKSDSAVTLRDHFGRNRTSDSLTPVRPVLGQLGSNSANSIEASVQPNKRRLQASIWDRDFPTQKVWVHRRLNNAEGDNSSSVYCLSVCSSATPEEPAVIRNAATIATELSQDSDDFRLQKVRNIRVKSTAGKQIFLAGPLKDSLQQKFSKLHRGSTSPDKLSNMTGVSTSSTADASDCELDTEILEGYRPLHEKLVTPTPRLIDRPLLSSSILTASKYFPSRRSHDPVVDDVACALGATVDGSRPTERSRSPVFNRNPFRINSNTSPSPPSVSSSPPFLLDNCEIGQLDKFLESDSGLIDIPSNPSNPSICDLTQPSTPPPSSSHDDDESFNTEQSPNFLSSHVTQPVATLISSNSNRPILRTYDTPPPLQSSSSIQRFSNSPFNNPLRLGSLKRSAETPPRLSSSNTKRRRSIASPSPTRPNVDLRQYFSKWRFQSTD